MKKIKKKERKPRFEIPGEVRLVKAQMKGKEENERIQTIARIINGILDKNARRWGQKSGPDFVKTIEDVIEF